MSSAIRDLRRSQRRTPEVLIEVVSPGSNVLDSIEHHFRDIDQRDNHALERDDGVGRMSRGTLLRCYLILLGLCVSAIAWPRSQPMRLVTATGTLHGTLELPAGRGPFPVALIIAGSGPTDRDGNDKSLGLDTDCYKLLAQYLVRRGVASLRYDKRGAGDDFVLAIPESQLRFQTYVSDAVQWGEKLRHDSRFSTLTIIGHSEGSLIGMLAARKIPADGFVSIAGAGERASKLLLKQLKPKVPGGLYETAQAIVAQLRVGRTVAKIPQSLDVLFRPSVQPYLISWFQFDPAREIAKLRIPVLIVQGERDLQVSTGDAQALHRANPAATLILIPTMNHVMKGVGPSNSDNMGAYAEPSLTIDATLERSIGGFILHLTSERESYHGNWQKKNLSRDQSRTCAPGPLCRASSRQSGGQGELGAQGRVVRPNPGQR